MFQQAMVVGYLGRDPELRFLETGVAVCDFSVATTEKWKDKNTDEKREKTTWFRVTCWRGLAETVNQYLGKGSAVLVVGTVQASAWIGKDGEARAQIEITAREVKFLPRGGGSGHENPEKTEEFGETIPF